MSNHKDCELHMWEYWRNDKGLEVAATEYYPKIFRSDPVLVMAMADLKAAKQLIDMRMEYLANQKTN